MAWSGNKAQKRIQTAREGKSQGKGGRRRDIMKSDREDGGTPRAPFRGVGKIQTQIERDTRNLDPRCGS
eukprot:c40721_g1_i1 orf=33-239(+)